MQKAKEGLQQKPAGEQLVQTEEEKVSGRRSQDSPSDRERKEEKEKAKAGSEAGEKMKKAAAKTAKHQAIGKVKQPKRQVRKALAK